MNITEIAFRYQKPVFMVFIALLFYGAISYFTLPAREDPEIKIREAIVITNYPGLNAERVEQLITKKLEREIRAIAEVKEIRSSSVTGQSIIHVDLQDQYFNLDDIWQDLRNKVANAQSQLPDGTIPSIINDEFGDVAVATLALTADDFDMAALYDKAKHIRDVLYRVKGTKKIDILGVQDERIFMEISNAKLAQLGITPGALINILQSQNIIRPGGTLDTGSKSFVIEPTGNFDHFDDIGKTLISLPGTGDILALSDLVDIRRDFIDPPQNTSYFNGKRAIIFAISMLPGNNILEYAPRLENTINETENILPVGMNLDVATFQAEQVQNTVYGVSMNVVQTLAIVLVVVMLFLGMRTGLIVGAIVPFVILTTLAIMNINGMELERMSLATLIIALGLLIDNGIVIAEDFKRRLEEGITRDNALKQCGSELATPLFISSLTTILVFLPLMLAEHVAGEYTRSISLVIMISLLSSWVLAMCITPILCYYFLKVDPNEKKSSEQKSQKSFMDKVYESYAGLLHWVLRFKALFLTAVICVFIGSITLMGFVPQQFFPDSDRAQVLIYTQLPAGTTSRTTDARMQDMFKLFNNKEEYPHVESFLGYVGYGGPRFVLSLSPEDPAENKGFVVLNVAGAENMQATIEKVRKDAMNHFPDMLVRAGRMFLGPTDSSKLEVQVKGPDADVLYKTAKEIEALFRDVPSTIDIRNNWENRTTKIVVKVDQQRARRAGVTSADIAASMGAFFNGTVVTEFREGDDIIPIIFRADAQERFNLDRMRSMNVYSSARNTNIPLFQIADFVPDNQYARIDRENMFRTITIEGKNTAMTAEDMKAFVDPKIQEINQSLPLNHWIEYDGVIAESASAQEALSANIPIVLCLVVVLLVIQFNSFLRPVIIVLTIPLSLIGAVVGLLLTGSFFGFMVTLGFYSLAGIIINNGIVLIDRIDIERRNGASDYDALVKACVMRLRPITMTTITTILGLLPLILSHDPLFYGMSNAMAFGLGVGTILTLGVVPVLYAMFFKIKSPQKVTS